MKPQRKTGRLAILAGECVNCDSGCSVWCAIYNETDPPDDRIRPPWHDGCSCYVANVRPADALAAGVVAAFEPEGDEPPS